MGVHNLWVVKFVAFRIVAASVFLAPWVAATSNRRELVEVTRTEKIKAHGKHMSQSEEKNKIT
jgi:hypothetical protein